MSMESVSEIKLMPEAEQAIVQQNKKLIEIFETKIQTAITTVWGE